MKTRILARLAVVAAAVMAATLAAAEGGKKIAIISWNDSEPRYAITRKAALEALDKEGFTALNVDFTMYDAKGDKKALAEMIKKAKTTSPDAYFAFGTSAAVPVAKEITDKPVAISMVYDPISANIIKGWNSSENNVTGSSNFVSIPGFMRRVIKRSEGTWTIKTIGIIFTPGEKNSELQAAAVRTVEADLGVKMVDMPVANPEDVKALVAGLKGKADLIYVTGSNIVGTNIAAIIAAANKNKIITATHLDDLVDRGVLIGLVAEPNEVGRLAGLAMAKVLKGAQPSAVPVVYPMPRLMLNQKTIEEGKFSIPPAMAAWAKSAEKI